MDIETAYAYGKTVELSCSEAEKRVREELSKEGFGILTEIDFRQKFSEKLQKEFREYRVLGACIPQIAYEALGREVNLGALMPCNVLVYARDDGRTAVVAMDPVAALSLVGNAEMTELAGMVSDKLRRVLAAL